MSNWQVGDLALCIGSTQPWQIVGKDIYDGNHPICGEINAVSELHFSDGDGYLCFHAYPDNAYFFQSFRKIKPDNKPCEEEFTALLKLSKKRSVKA